MDGSVAIYARQSRASRSAYTSCEAQVESCRAFAMSRGLEAIDIFVDEVQSSETLDRPALNRLLKAIESGEVKHLVVYSLDRLTRKVLHLLELLEILDKAKVKLLVVSDPSFSDTAVSRLLTNVVAAASEFQLELTRERMADMRTMLKQHGKRVAGRVPFGYIADPVTKALIAHPEQAKVVRDFFELASQGSRPSELATMANLNEWKDQKGVTGKWAARRIIKLLTNPVYVGKIHNSSSTLPGEHGAIVRQEVFDAVAIQLRSRQTRTIKTNEKGSSVRKSHLVGILICGQCNRLMGTSV
jgi:site-specific DNA recombinase